MALTPMMRQYLEIKENYSDAILFYRLGDFYEMFMEDAKVASSILEIALTGRDAGLAERIPMCGIPYHAASGYIAKLIDKGLKVAICEQVEDPKLTKGIVKREVIRVITPGTILEELSLKEKENNFIGALVREGDCFALAAADISTGEFRVTAIRTTDGIRRVLDEISRLELRELVTSEEALNEQLSGYTGYRSSHPLPPSLQAVNGLIRFSDMLLGADAMKQAASLLYAYLDYTQKGNLAFIRGIEAYALGYYMTIDTWSRRNLELTRSLRGDGSANTLLSVLDKTRTAFGGRLLKRWLEQPLLDREEIERRLDIVGLLVDDLDFSQEVRDALKGIYDIERLLGRLSYGSGNARDLLALKSSLEKTARVKNLLVAKGSPLLSEMIGGIRDYEELAGLLDEAISEDAPLTIRDGGIIRTGFNLEVDELRKLNNDSKEFIKALEQREKDRLGIKSLKVGYNKVFGYYIEITKLNAHLAPPEYIRKQTIAGGERFINEELKELEYKIIHSRDKLGSLEHELFLEIRGRVLKEIEGLRSTALEVARLDVLASFAAVANMNDYKRPRFTEGRSFRIVEGRHPIVEKLVEQERYVSNDFDIAENNLAIITGPNMAGKSTFIRMLAILTVMAQCGSFVPAESFELGIADRVFARVGASDDLGSGQSTFMVEMNEVATILNNATEKSLIILDEVGRGTSTLDGLSIAWAMSEYLLTRIKARTVFATHYHELIELEQDFANVCNLSMAVQEYKDQVVFLRKVVAGGADKSYGLHVARMAGLPEDLLKRAEVQMDYFEGKEPVVRESQGTFDFVEVDNPTRDLLREVNPNALTPLEALELVYRLKKLEQEKP